VGFLRVAYGGIADGYGVFEVPLPPTT